jgi:hypothetical protein
MKQCQLPKNLDLLELLICRKGAFMNAAVFKKVSDAFNRGQIHVLGISDAHHFYQSNGMQRVQALADAQPCHNILISDQDVARRILRIWPAEEKS